MLRENGFLIDIEQSDGSALTMAGSPLRLSGTPIEHFRRAPTLDEHRAEILNDWLDERAHDFGLEFH